MSKVMRIPASLAEKYNSGDKIVCYIERLELLLKDFCKVFNLTTYEDEDEPFMVLYTALKVEERSKEYDEDGTQT